MQPVGPQPWAAGWVAELASAVPQHPGLGWDPLGAALPLQSWRSWAGGRAGRAVGGRVLAAGRRGQNLPVCPGLEALPSLLFIFNNSFSAQDLCIYVFGFHLFVLTIQEEPVIWPLGTLACSRV